MIIAALLLQAAAEPPRMTVGQFRAVCAEGTGGDSAALARCRTFVDRKAEDIRTDPETSTCMAVPDPSPDEIAWAVIDGLAAAEMKDDADAGSAVTATLISAYPCGIVRKN